MCDILYVFQTRNNYIGVKEAVLIGQRENLTSDIVKMEVSVQSCHGGVVWGPLLSGAGVAPKFKQFGFFYSFTH